MRSLLAPYSKAVLIIRKEETVFMKFSKKAAVFLIASALISSNVCIPTLADTPAAGIQAEDFENGDGLGIFAGSIGGSVSTYEEKDGNHCMYVAPYTDGVTAFAQYALDYSEKVKLNISLDFKQKDKRADGVCLFGLSKNGSDLVRIETKNGNIVMKKESSSIDIVLVKGYAVNRYYRISADINYTNGFVSVYVDGELKAEEQKLLQSEKPADLFYVSTKYSPGICIDNFKIVPEQHTDRITFDGETSLNVSEKKDSQYTYTAMAYDQNGVAMKNAVSFMLLPQNEGITLKQGEDTAYLTVTKEAAGKTFTLTAQSGSVTVSKELTVNAYTSSISKMEIKGDAKLAASISDYPYTVTCYDQFGDVMDNEECTFSLSGNVPDNLTLDSSTGRITVSGELPKDKHITLTATSKTDPSVKAYKKLTLLDSETYANDTARFEALIGYIDTVRGIGRDPYHDTPLIADVWDVSSQQPGEWRSGTKAGIGITSNLACKGGWFRTLEAVYNLTGDEQYKKEITDTYQYYLDHYIDEESGLPYWGGHAAVDLKEGKGYMVDSATYHELKNNAVYMKPFFDLDPEKAEKIIKDIFCSHMVDWKALMFNRHGKYQHETDTSNWDSWKTWTNTVQSETFGPNSYISDMNISFRATGSDFMDLLGDLYKYTGDRGALTWAKNILDCYWRVENPETLVGGYQSSSSYKMARKLPDGWYLPQNYVNRLSFTDYGDRFYNQFADDLVDQGFLREDEKWMALEPFTSNIDDYNLTPMHDLALAKNFGLESEDGARILEHAVKKMGMFVDQAYHADTNEFSSRLLSNGKPMNGFVLKKCGYYGTDIGTVYGNTNVPAITMLTYSQVYLDSKDRPDLEEYRDKIYYLIRNYFKATDLGDLGEKYPGDNMNLNMDTTLSDGYFCMVMTYLYRATGITEYLDAARRIADNFINNNMVDGLFWLDSDARFIPLGGWKAERMHHALAMLEATVRDEAELLPDYIPFDAYFADDSWLDMEKGYTNESEDFKSITEWFGASLDSVDAKKIIIPERDIHLSPGEEKFLEITVLPMDADSSLVYDSTNPECVAVDYGKNKLIARKKGKTIITVSNSDKTAKATLHVTVE